jgi:hypothetical protein
VKPSQQQSLVLFAINDDADNDLNIHDVSSILSSSILHLASPNPAGNLTHQTIHTNPLAFPRH